MQAVLPWAVAPVLFVLVSAIPRIRHSTILNNPVLTRLGAISFSIYLLHPIALALADRYLPAGAAFVSGLAGTLILAAIAYHLVEKPGQVFGKRLTRPARIIAVPAGV
jgi:peptidoglycan/LPS O-acetylase OafA/YrhL